MENKRKRSETLTIRVTEKEKQYIKKRADKADLSVTDYIIRLSNETPIYIPVDMQPFLLELKRIGNNIRSSNILLDAGIGTLTAVASLMDNDQDDDPEEKKKKLDAKDAGSNFGFAVGSSIGLAAALIAKSKKQDENITETPTEEPDESREIDIDTYEESEDLDKNEGFTMQM